MIAGVLEVECETVDEVVSYLERGSTYRHTGLTRMNEHSSRSHSVFTLVIGQSLLISLLWCCDVVKGSGKMFTMGGTCNSKLVRIMQHLQCIYCSSHSIVTLVIGPSWSSLLWYTNHPTLSFVSCPAMCTVTVRLLDSNEAIRRHESSEYTMYISHLFCWPSCGQHRLGQIAAI